MKCHLYAASLSDHVSQLYTGFALLAANKRITLTHEFAPYSPQGKVLMGQYPFRELAGLFVVINDKLTVFYDTRDGGKVYEDALEHADAYFKRSYLESAIPDRFRHKVFPLGLNYKLFADRFNRYQLARFFSRPIARQIVDTPRDLLTNLAFCAGLHFRPTVLGTVAPPAPDRDPRVLFMVRTWDPAEAAPGPEREQFFAINERRAEVIALLRKELGARFYGGFSHTSHAIKHYKPMLLKNGWQASKRRYLSLLNKFPICIATTGLHGSIGWKMGEYVAFSKAIVCEPLNYLVPYGFANQRHYFEFETAEQCVEQTLQLVDDKPLRQQIMENNAHYYQTCLRPDQLVAKTLEIALGLPV